MREHVCTGLDLDACRHGSLNQRCSLESEQKQFEMHDVLCTAACLH